MSDQDLILTTERVFLFEKKKNKGYLAYAEVAQCYTGNGLQFGKSKYANSAVDIGVLLKITEALASLQGKYKESVDDKDIESLVRTVKQNIERKYVHNEFTDYENSLQEVKKQHKNSAEDKGNLEKVVMESYNTTLYIVEATVSKGPLFVGNYCALNGTGLYTIEKIGYGNTSDMVAEVGKRTKFTLRKYC